MYNTVYVYEEGITMKAKIGSLEIELTEEFQAALETMEHTNQSIFITGKAGTGKSTLIELFRQETKKKVVFLAPTGVSALRINGQTIHSFFQLPPTLFDKHDVLKLSNKRLEVFEKVQTIVIDEISMVRADIMDGIDYSLRLNRNIDEPFGGVQMIFIGDLYQLPPVVEKDLGPYFYNQHDKYGSPWFFSSEVIRHKDKFYKLMKFIELTRIFRQDQEKQYHFITILNDLRINNIDNEKLDMLNTRFKIGQKPDPSEIRLTICTKNNYANYVNNRKLNELKTQEYTYEAIATGTFMKKKNRDNYPTEPHLTLKEGAQIMMVKNDTNGRWVNGTLGLIHKLTDKTISVNINDGIYDVKKEQWSEIKYVYNPKTKEITGEIVGTFIQYPISLAWAFTIHKSQGQTFEKVSIMAQGAWEHGQVYVAVSRCKTMEGIILETPIRRADVHVNPLVDKFLKVMSKQS